MSDEVDIGEKGENLPLEEIPGGELAGPEIEPEEIDDLIPKMNVSVQGPEQAENLVSDDALLGIYHEILENIRDDRKQIGEFVDNFAELVVNGGDATTSSKEALVNLIKMKSDQSDKMAKVADLMTRVKLKQPDTFPKYLAAQQNNTINIGETGQSKRALLEAIKKAKKKDKK